MGLVEHKLTQAAAHTNAANGSSGEDVCVFPITVAQRRFWLLDQLKPGNPALNVPLAAKLKGCLERAILERTVNELVRRHEMLRTNFRTLDGAEVQVIHSERTIELAWRDITDCAKSEREAQVQKLMIEEAGRAFVLGDGSLLRCGLIKVADDEHVLTVTMHHIVCDGWSNGIVMREIAQIYSAILTGHPGLSELPLQYADFAQWQNQWLESPAAAAQLQFWKTQLTGVLPVLNLPTDRPRRDGRSHEGAIRTRLLPKTLTDALAAKCGRQDFTPFMLYLATYAVLLYRYTGKTDVIIGSPAANRNQTDLEDLIGLFANPLILRLNLSGNPTFGSLLKRVRDLSLSVFAHQDYPFEKVLEVIQTDPNRSGIPWLQAYFVFQKAFMASQRMPNLTLNPLRSVSPGAMFEWMMGIVERPEGIRLQLEYNTELYDQATAERVLHQFQNVLELILADEDLRIDDLPLLTETERHLLLVNFNQTTSAAIQQRLVVQQFEEQVSRAPEALAIQSGEMKLTFAQLNFRANQMAHHLRSVAVEPGSGIGLAVDVGSVEFLIGFLGILKSGGCAVIFDMRAGDAALVKATEENKLAVLVTDSNLPPRLRSNKLRTVFVDLDAKVIAAASGANIPVHVLGEQPACIRFSSGRSGAPKGSVISHEALLHSANAAIREFNLRTEDRVSFTIDEMLPALLTGAALVFFTANETFDPAEWLRGIYLVQVTVAGLPAACWHECVRLLASNVDFPLGQLRTLAIRGEQISPVARAVWRRKTVGRVRLLDQYFLTETAGGAAFIEPVVLDGIPERSAIVRPAPSCRIYVLDENYQPVPIGVPGNLYVGGPNLARRYLDSEMDESNSIADTFSDAPGGRLLKTGDFGRFLPGGGIELLGRNEDIARTNGFKLELYEVRSTFLQHPAIWEAVIVPQETEGTRSLNAYVVVKPNASVQAAELRAFAAEHLPSYMVPSAIINLEKLPLTFAGKVDREALLKLPKAKHDFLTTYEPARTPLELKLCAVWCEVLRVKRVGIHDKFFESGGNSLLSLSFVAKARQAGVPISVRQIFQHQTIAELAKALSTQIGGKRTPELIQLRAGQSGAELVFLIDEGSLGLFKLAPLLDDDLALYASLVPMPETALRAAASNQFSILPRMEELAAEHVALIKRRQTDRPLLLGGRCFGGLLAFEVAHQLQHVGRRVEGVLLLDTWMTRTTYWWRKKTWFHAHFRNLMEQGPRYVWRKGRRRINLEKDDLASRLKLAANGDFSVHVPWAIMQRIYRHATNNYSPQVLSSRGILFVSEDDWKSNAFRQDDNSLGADRFFTGGVKVMNVPGDHVTVLDEVNLPRLAQRYREGLKNLELGPVFS